MHGNARKTKTVTKAQPTNKASQSPENRSPNVERDSFSSHSSSDSTDAHTQPKQRKRHRKGHGKSKDFQSATQSRPAHTQQPHSIRAAWAPTYQAADVAQVESKSSTASITAHSRQPQHQTPTVIIPNTNETSGKKFHCPQYTEQVLAILLTGANIATNVLVSSSDRVYRSVVISGGSAALMASKLSVLLEKGAHTRLSKEDFGLCCMGFTLAMAPALIYPFATDDAHSYIPTVLAALGIAMPAFAGFLMKQYALSSEVREQEDNTPENWKSFFFTRQQLLRMIGGGFDIAFNNILASLWMSNDQISYRFWATFPNALLTAGINTSDVWRLQNTIDSKARYDRTSCSSILCHPAVVLLGTALFTGGAYCLAMAYSAWVGSELTRCTEDQVTSLMQISVGSLSFLLSQYLSYKAAIARTPSTPTSHDTALTFAQSPHLTSIQPNPTL